MGQSRFCHRTLINVNISPSNFKKLLFHPHLSKMGQINPQSGSTQSDSNTGFGFIWSHFRKMDDEKMTFKSLRVKCWYWSKFVSQIMTYAKKLRQLNIVVRFQILHISTFSSWSLFVFVNWGFNFLIWWF